MVDRLSPADSSFLYLEDVSAPMHIGQVLIFDQPEGFTGASAVTAIAARLSDLPRYRQRVRSVPGRLAGPVWSDDPDFDIDYHVRRSALPRPGTEEQLAEFVARVSARPLDRDRPLWECYVVEGLTGGRFALVTKVHQALIDSISTRDIVGLSPDPRARFGAPKPWSPRPEPGNRDLLTDAIGHLVSRPTGVRDTLRAGIGELRATAGRVGRVGSVLARSATRPTSRGAFEVTPASARRYRMHTADLADFREVRTAFATAGRELPSIHAIILTVIAGALRVWLQGRGEHIRADRSVRAMVPATTAAGEMVAVFVDLPIGEASPLVRLHQIEFSLAHQVRTEQGMRAVDLAAMGGSAPPALHALGVRLGSSLSQRLFDLVITNVPGPQRRMYGDGVPLLATYPVLPLTRGNALAIGMTSYLGVVHFGIVADRDAVPDIDQISAGLTEALEELRDWIARDPSTTKGFRDD